MAKAPLPTALPGEFFVVTYDRRSGVYRMIVDDATHSSYNLGDDVQASARYFRQIGLDETGCRALDVAREFEAAQAVIADGRVTPVKPELPKQPAAKKPAGLIQLPRL